MHVLRIMLVGDDEYRRFELDDEQYERFLELFEEDSEQYGILGMKWGVNTEVKPNFITMKPSNYLCGGVVVNLNMVKMVVFE